jgi:hypothetical protein
MDIRSVIHHDGSTAVGHPPAKVWMKVSETVDLIEAVR